MNTKLLTGATILFAAATLWSTAAASNPLGMTMRTPAPAEDFVTDGSEERANLPAHLKRQIVAYATHEAPGTIIIDTANTHLYFVLGNGRAIRYGIGVGRDG